jgi:hypothetical protein
MKTINRDVPEILDVKGSVGGAANRMKEKNNEAAALFWFASWHVIWETVDWCVHAFCEEDDCCKVVAKMQHKARRPIPIEQSLVFDSRVSKD